MTTISNLKQIKAELKPIIISIIQNTLKEEKFMILEVKNWTNNINRNIILNFLQKKISNYRFCCSTYILEKGNCGFFFNSSKLNDVNEGDSLEVKYENQNLICFSIVLGVKINKKDNKILKRPNSANKNYSNNMKNGFFNLNNNINNIKKDNNNNDEDVYKQIKDKKTGFLIRQHFLNERIKEKNKNKQQNPIRINNFMNEKINQNNRRGFTPDKRRINGMNNMGIMNMNMNNINIGGNINMNNIGNVNINFIGNLNLNMNNLVNINNMRNYGTNQMPNYEMNKMNNNFRNNIQIQNYGTNQMPNYEMNKMNNNFRSNNQMLNYGTNQMPNYEMNKMNNIFRKNQMPNYGTNQMANYEMNQINNIFRKNQMPNYGPNKILKNFENNNFNNINNNSLNNLFCFFIATSRGPKEKFSVPQDTKIIDFFKGYSIKNDKNLDNKKICFLYKSAVFNINDQRYLPEVIENNSTIVETYV